MRKMDPRVIRTRQMLHDALLALILEHGYDSINIQHITDRAGLRRATFYLHYRDKEELMFEVLREFYEGIIAEFKSLPFAAMTLDAERTVQLAVFRHAQQHSQLYRAIFAGQGSNTIIRYIRDYLVVAYRDMCAVDERLAQANVPLEVLGTFESSIKISMVQWWLDNDMPYTPEEMADMCARLTMRGVESALMALPPMPVS